MSTNSYINNEPNFTGDRIVAFFSRRQDAYRAIQALSDAGFTHEQIGLIAQSDLDQADTSTSSSETSSSAGQDRSFWDGVKDFFRGESHDDDDEPQYAHATGDLGWKDDRTNYYRQGISSGGALVTVTGARAGEARRILETNGGDLRESGFDSSAIASSATNTASMSDRNADHDTDQRIQLRGERLRAYKERVQRGEVTLRKDVITENQQIEVPVTREELVIERNAVPGNTPASGDIGSDREIRVPLSEERVQVNKEQVVNEEVRVGKRPVQRTERVGDEVRHEELRVDKEGDVDADVDRTARKRNPAA